MLIESLAQKTRLAMMTVFAVIGGCTVICAFTVWCCISLVNEERQQIYVLDGDIPFLAERARLEANFTMEAKAHIQLFHQYFFNLPPDNDYIKWTVGKAMYMADGTALKQKLIEKITAENLPVDTNDERLLKEVLLYADKADITEEITRLESHFRQFDGFLAASEPVGRSLDFLLQEMFREITTLGNKAGSSDITPIVVAFKSELEKIREQVQNIE